MSSLVFVSPLLRVTDAVARVRARIGGDRPDLVGLSDDDLLGLLADAADARKGLDLVVATAAAEVSRRSGRELGYDGLAQRKGLRTGVALVQQITGQSRTDASRAVQAGGELAAGLAMDSMGRVSNRTPGWLAGLRAAMVSGQISQAQFQAIRTGLGDPPVERYPELDPGFLPEAWDRAVVVLLDEAGTWTVEDLRDQARIARDRLDPVGVTLRFEERFQARSFRRWTDEAGQHHARIVFDDDAAAWVDTILRAGLRPRRGPRFVDSAAAGPRPEAAPDERSNEQLQYDTLIAVLRTGASADPGQAFGDRQPGVRIVVDVTSVSDPDRRGAARVTGVGHFEDGGQAIPPGIVEKYLCDAGSIPVILDEHHRPLDVGREHRLFTRKQRIAIAARDGGCIMPGCGRPPSECEYHHLDHWWEDHGRTDVDDGVPLCRNCHMRLHNQGQRITRERDPSTGEDTYWLHPPPHPGAGDIADPILLRTRSPRRFEAA